MAVLEGVPDKAYRAANYGGNYSLGWAVREESTGHDLKLMDLDLFYVRLKSKFRQELNELRGRGLLTLYDEEVEALFNSTCWALLTVNPDKISVELSLDGSVVFTIIKDGYTIFFERYFDSDDGPEVVYSVYLNKKKLPSFAGTFELAMSSIIKDIFSVDALFSAQDSFYVYSLR